MGVSRVVLSIRGVVRALLSRWTRKAMSYLVYLVGSRNISWLMFLVPRVFRRSWVGRVANLALFSAWGATPTRTKIPSLLPRFYRIGPW